MKALRCTALVGALLLLLSAAPALAGPSDAPYTSFEAKSEGSPVPWAIGSWSNNGNATSTDLEFKGSHVLGSKTTFVATWQTPFTEAGKAPGFESSYELMAMNERGKDILLVESLALRNRGGKWREFPPLTLKIEPGTWNAGGGSGLLTTDTRPIQVRWQLTGSIEAFAYLEGSYSMTIAPPEEAAPGLSGRSYRK